LHMDVRVAPQRYVVSTTHEDDTVLLDVKSARYYSLNAVGGDVWAALCERDSLATIADRIVERFGIARQTVETDILDLVGQLLTASLVERVA